MRTVSLRSLNLPGIRFCQLSRLLALEKASLLSLSNAAPSSTKTGTSSSTRDATSCSIETLPPASSAPGSFSLPPHGFEALTSPATKPSSRIPPPLCSKTLNRSSPYPPSSTSTLRYPTFLRASKRRPSHVLRNASSFISSLTVSSSSRISSISPLSVSPYSSFPFAAVPRRWMSSSIQSLEELEAMLNPGKQGRVSPEELDEALRMEYEFFKFNGQPVPSDVSEAQWKDLRKMRTVEERMDLYRIYYLKEISVKTEEEKTAKGRFQERLRQEKLKRMFGEENMPDTHYGDDGRSVFGAKMSPMRWTNDYHVKEDHKHHVLFGLNFGQPLVYDLGVDYQMTAFESSSFRFQMREVYGNNRSHWEPFNLFLCNYNKYNIHHRKLVDDDMSKPFLWNVTSKCFTEIFPKEKIVYLTRQSRVPLRKFSHEAVYVIGACVDTRFGKDEMSKIKKLGVAHAFYDTRSIFVKNEFRGVPLNHHLLTLMDARDGDSNWVHSFRNFSRRRFRYVPTYQRMNAVKVDQEKTLVNWRSIFSPKSYDPENYVYYTEEELHLKFNELNKSEREKEEFRRRRREGREEWDGKEIDVPIDADSNPLPSTRKFSRGPQPQIPPVDDAL